MRVIDADHNRVDLVIKTSRLVVSPENSRESLTRFIRKAKQELLIYDVGVTDDKMIAIIKERAEAGVKVRILGNVEQKWASEVPWRVKAFKTMKLHVRCIIRDRETAFVGSQSLRKLELDQRREVGMITKDRRTVKQMALIFDGDWKKN